MLLKEVASIAQGMTTSGRGAGAREGDWTLNVIESSDIELDTVRVEGLRTIDVEQNSWTEKHLLRPNDVLVTARSQSVKVGLVPPQLSRTVAGSTLLVVRPASPETGMGHFLWYYLTSTHGRAAVEGRVVAGATIPTLSRAALGELDVPVPATRELDILARFIEASEQAYHASIRAAHTGRWVLRDAIIGKLAAATANPG